MLRRAFAIVLVGVCLAPVTPAEAARPTCQGVRATIVGANAGAGRIVGTRGRDVVVTRGATRISTGDGRDLVCVSGRGRGPVRVDTGTGADRVVVTTSRRRVVPRLGRGDDVFVGGPADDVVEGRPGDGRDVIVAGSGNDRVVQASGPMPDVVLLGPGNDRLSLPPGGMTRRGRVDGGTGVDMLDLTRAPVPGDVVVDVPTRTATREGLPWLQLAAMEDYRIRYRDTLRFTGTDVDERLAISGGDEVDSGGADLAGGDDTFVVLAGAPLFTVAGGEGRNRLVVLAPGRPDLVVDAVLGAVTGFGRLDFVDFVDITARAAGTVVLRGSAADERLTASSCSTTIAGRAGDDRILAESWPGLGTTDCDDESGDVGGPARLEGGPGDDVLVGDRYDDRIIGGAGFDRADGRKGTDDCDAERTRLCNP